MTIEKKINYKEGAEKIKFLADLKAGYAKGGPTNKPNGLTTISLDDWLENIDPGGWASEEDKPVKVSFKYGATSQSEEDLIGGHVDDWTNAINKGDLDPSVDFMQYINMILGRDSVSRGGIVSIVPTL